MRLISFPVMEDRSDEVLDMQRLFADDEEAWIAHAEANGEDEGLPVGWKVVAQASDTDGDPGDTILLVHRTTTGGVALLYRDAVCLSECENGCALCMSVCRVEVTVADLLRGIERGIAQRVMFAGWVSPHVEVAMLRTVLASLYDLNDPTEAGEQVVVALGGPIRVLPAAAF